MQEILSSSNLKDKPIHNSIRLNESMICYKSPVPLILLGDHTHYNDGIIISSAFNKHTTVKVSKRDDCQVNIKTKWDNEEYFHPVEYRDFAELKYPIRNLASIINLLIENEYPLRGFNCEVSSDIPDCLGNGIYAAFQIPLLKSINELFELNISNEKIIELSRQAELKIIGKISNIAHHFTAMFSKLNHFTKLDLRTKEIEFRKADEPIQLMVMETGKRIKIEEICKERIEECVVGVKGLRLYIWGIRNLRDVKPDFLQKHVHMIPNRVYKRCLFNVTERERVANALDALKANDINSFGKIMFESHAALRDEYEISTEELDYIVKESSNIDDVIGSKILSCTPIYTAINILKKDFNPANIDLIKQNYFNKFGKELNIFELEGSSGVEDY